MTDPNSAPKKSIRWWPGVFLVVGMFLALAWVRMQGDWPFQKRNLTTAQIVIIVGILLVVWWSFFSRAPNRLRLSITFGIVGLAIVCAALFRLRGMSGDMMPIVEFRWAKQPELQVAPAGSTNIVSVAIATRPSFPQYLGPNRDGVLAGPKLDTNWFAHPPEVLWRHAVGAGWSGFVIVGDLAITQEQRGAEECVVAYELRTGKPVWQHTDKARYDTVIAGEGPRATPTVVSNRVFTCGGTGLLNSLDLPTGNRLWSRDLIAESGGKVPQWGYTCSPLVVANLVIVHGGEEVSQSLLAFDIETGQRVWSGGMNDPGYSAPRFATLAGVPQILSFNDRSVSAHNPTTGATLWEKPWGNGNVVCAAPVVIGSNQVLFSSGYGVGAELLEIFGRQTSSKEPTPNPSEEGNTSASALKFASASNAAPLLGGAGGGSPRKEMAATPSMGVRLVWKSIRMKSKFAHLYARDGHLYGLDDGIFACVNLADGSQRWKEGRYGHGQGLLVGDLYLLMAEAGELVLLHPTPEAPNELTRFRVFNAKTWNPIALSGDLLLVRNDQEAVCVRLKMEEK